MKNQVNERRVVKSQYFISCPVIGCKKEIKGNSKSHVLFNFEEHIKNHKKLNLKKAKGAEK